MARYQIWNKTDPVITPSGAQFTAQAWADRFAWVKLPGHARNEPLDCRDYAMAGLKIINPDMDAVERRLKGLAEPEPQRPQPRQRTKRSKASSAFDDW